jgi:hypothetical protein
MMSRRTWIAGAAAGAVLACARSRRPDPKTILVLGGTSFIGPAIVERALARGHTVTLFNRHPGNLPFWSATRRRSRFDHLSAAKAARVGWQTRPLESTAVDAWQSYRARMPADLTFPQTQWGFEWGITAERERALLAEWTRTHPS